QTKRVSDYQILSIMLYDEEQKIFRHRVDIKHGHHVQGKLRATSSDGIVGAAATLKEPVLVPDVTVDPRYLMVNPETRSELAIPMIHNGTVIGVRSLAPQKLQPAEMLKQMNQLVGERRIEGRFMTACFATWQKGRQKLRVANAGQSQPLLYKDGRCGKIELTGFPLGIFEDVNYDEWGVTLEAGNILVFHSDGIPETMNSESQFFGTTRLMKLIEQHHEASAAEIADVILREVDWFTQGAPLSDDRTLVVAKVR